MGSLIIGKPRSGKTYLAVHRIANLCKNSNDLEFIYTNIGGFKFDYMNQILEDNGKSLRVLFYDHDVIFKHLTALYAMFKDNKTDEELIEYCKLHDLNNAHFFIDEAHNIFDKQNKVLIWWLSYKGHIDHDYTLITQNKALIVQKYRGFPEYFTLAVPASHRLSSKTIKYIDYSDFAMSKSEKIKTHSLKMSNSIFNLYHSGSVIKPKLFIYKLIFSALVFLFIAGLVLYFLTRSKIAEVKDINTTVETPVKNEIYKTIEENTRLEDTQNIKVYCDEFDCTVYKGRQEASYPYQYFISVLGTIDAKILYQRAMYVYQGQVSSDVEMYVKIKNEDLNYYFTDIYKLRNDYMDNEAFKTSLLSNSDT